MNELIKISYENAERPTVSGRELHEALEVKTAYKDWFPRMCEYGFTEGEDFNPLKNEQVRMSLMITSNACRICSLEAEMTENTMRSDKAMKLYKVTTIDQYHYKRVFTVAAKSQYEALTKASVICPHENVLTIEEVD